MAFNYEYPYVDPNRYNSDWVLNTISEYKEKIDNFVSLNTIKYANPIRWNITTQYASNTIVIDPDTGTAYISSRPVPTGIELTNTDYWNVIFDLNRFNTAVKNSIAADLGDNAVTPSKLNTGALVWYKDVLYIATKDIKAKESVIVGSNIEKITVEYWVNSLATALQTQISDNHNNLNTEIVDREAADTEIKGLIDAETQARKTLDTIVKSGITNILTLGAKNDGSEDVSDIINNFDGPLFLPYGKYLVSSPITVKYGLYGEGIDRRSYGNNYYQTELNCTVANPITLTATSGSVTLANLKILGNNKTGSVVKINNSFATLDYVHIYGFAGIGIDVDAPASRNATINNTIVDSGLYGTSTANATTAVQINSPDCHINNLTCISVKYGIYAKRFTQANDVHIYTGMGDPMTASYLNSTRGIISAEGFIGNNIYIDTASIPFVTESKGFITVCGFFYYTDSNIDTNGIIYYNGDGTGSLTINGAEIETGSTIKTRGNEFSSTGLRIRSNSLNTHMYSTVLSNDRSWCMRKTKTYGFVTAFEQYTGVMFNITTPTASADFVFIPGQRYRITKYGTVNLWWVFDSSDARIRVYTDAEYASVTMIGVGSGAFFLNTDMQKKADGSNLFEDLTSTSGLVAVTEKPAS